MIVRSTESQGASGVMVPCTVEFGSPPTTIVCTPRCPCVSRPICSDFGWTVIVPVGAVAVRAAPAPPSVAECSGRYATPDSGWRSHGARRWRGTRAAPPPDRYSFARRWRRYSPPRYCPRRAASTRCARCRARLRPPAAASGRARSARSGCALARRCGSTAHRDAAAPARTRRPMGSAGRGRAWSRARWRAGYAARRAACACASGGRLNGVVAGS